MACKGKERLHLLMERIYPLGDCRDGTFCIGEEEFYKELLVLVEQEVILQ